jgi:hypothetical protein
MAIFDIGGRKCVGVSGWSGTEIALTLDCLKVRLGRRHLSRPF